MKLNEYMTTAEAAKYLGVSQPTLRKWEKSKRIPSYTNPLNLFKLYKKEDLDILLNNIQANTNGRK